MKKIILSLILTLSFNPPVGANPRYYVSPYAGQNASGQTYTYASQATAQYNRNNNRDIRRTSNERNTYYRSWRSTGSSYGNLTYPLNR